MLDLSQFGLGVEAAEALARSDAFPRLEELRLPYAIRPTRGIGRLLRQKSATCAGSDRGLWSAAARRRFLSFEPPAGL